MMKVAVLCPYPRGAAPSQRFRFEQYIDYLSEEAISIEAFPFLSNKAWQTFYQSNKRITTIFHVLLGIVRRILLLRKLRQYDWILIHREAAPVGPPVIEWVLAKVMKKRIIYDFDDAIWLPNYSKQNRLIHRIKAYWKVKYLIRWANKVVVGNAFLANYAKPFNANITIIPTTIDENYHIPTSSFSREVIIGWTGTHTTVDYLKKIVPDLECLAQRHTFKFLVISNEPPDFFIPNLVFKQWNEFSEIEDLSQISIGVMPLTNDEWAKGKCGFKALQYMALGIPTVASNVGVNEELIKHGEQGFLMEEGTSWLGSLESLIQDEALRVQMGEKGKIRVKEAYSVEAQKNNYKKLFLL